jgi:hypothetical protein
LVTPTGHRKVIEKTLSDQPLEYRLVLGTVSFGGLAGIRTSSVVFRLNFVAKGLDRRDILRLQADAPVENRSEGSGVRRQ